MSESNQGIDRKRNEKMDGRKMKRKVRMDPAHQRFYAKIFLGEIEDLLKKTEIKE